MLLSVSKYIFNSLHTTLLILAVYTLPFFTLDYICNISGNMFSYILCTHKKLTFYTSYYSSNIYDYRSKNNKTDIRFKT